MLANSISSNQIIVQSKVEKKKVGRKPIAFPPPADNYINQLKIQEKDKKYYRLYISKFLKFISQNYMNDCSLSEIDFCKIESHHIESYVKSLSDEGGKSNYLFHLKCLFEFNGMTCFLALIKKEPLPQTNSDKLVASFVKYLDARKYSQTNTNKKHINLFVKFLKNNIDTFKNDREDIFFDLEEQHLNDFERNLITKSEKGIIKKCYVYSQLRSLALFIKYLREQNITDLRYTPPRFLQRNAARRNDYIEEVEIREMLQIVTSTFKRNKYLFRNISIFLILMYTGCRPIEVSNMNLGDIWKTDYTISLKSKKSKQRRLKLNKEIFSYLKEYLAIREQFSPIDESLFVSKNGTRLNPMSIYHIFHKLNLRLYSESKNPPVAFRHTFITNALESGTDLRTVASASGHKHLISTDYYRERSPSRLFENSIDHDPTEKFEEEFFYDK